MNRNLIMNTPTEERLQRMSYTELRKIARRSGINGKKKATDLIALILKNANSADDSFNALEQEIMNSCEKNKIERFEKDMATPSDTPKRDTYTLENPVNESLIEENNLVSSSASPALKKLPESLDQSVTMTRGSEMKAKKRKVSFVTPIRRSARLSTLTPQFTSIKDRPKTPIPSRGSSVKKEASIAEENMFIGSLFITNSARNSGRKSLLGGKRPSTPMPKPKPKRMKLDSLSFEAPSVTPISTPVASTTPLSNKKQLKIATPKSSSKSASTSVILSVSKGRRSSPRVPTAKVHAMPNEKTQNVTPKDQPKKVPLQLSSSKAKRATPITGNKIQASLSVKKQTATPRTQLKQTPLKLSSAKVKGTTPNFKILHQKQFDKMESIDEYVKRKQVTSIKKVKDQHRIQDKVNSSKKLTFKNSKIPKKFNGIPFVPTVISTSNMKTDFGFSKLKSNATPGKRLPVMRFGLHNESGLSKKLIGGGASKVVVPKPKPKENTPLRKRNTPLQKKNTPLQKRNTPLQKKNTPLLKKNASAQKKFDLKASLSRKLTYKPHAGPLKPLGQINMNASVFISNELPPQKAPVENRVIKAKRAEIRGVLHGVRKNKRFELQMKNRKGLNA